MIEVQPRLRNPREEGIVIQKKLPNLRWGPTEGTGVERNLLEMKRWDYQKERKKERTIFSLQEMTYPWTFLIWRRPRRWETEFHQTPSIQRVQKNPRNRELGVRESLLKKQGGGFPRISPKIGREKDKLKTREPSSSRIFVNIHENRIRSS